MSNNIWVIFIDAAWVTCPFKCIFIIYTHCGVINDGALFKDGNYIPFS